MRKSFIIFTILLSSKAFAFRDVVYGESVIYGEDNRNEAKDYKDPSFVKKSLSVAIRVSNRKLESNQTDPNIIDFLKISLDKSMPNICVTERFIDQYQLGDCSGFLIAKNKILTAGHCAFSEFDCVNNSWVFGFTNDKTQLDKKDVYQCKSIVAQTYHYDSKSILDYAIIELDRDTDREPLAFRKHGRPLIGTPLLIIGHPVGLPTKIADGASVKFLNQEEMNHPFQSLLLRKNYFTANLDSYGGNSGSPVFNIKTGKVEGILIQGADDFNFDEVKNCLISNHLSNSYKNSFEKVLRITEIPELK